MPTTTPPATTTTPTTTTSDRLDRNSRGPELIDGVIDVPSTGEGSTKDYYVYHPYYKSLQDARDVSPYPSPDTTKVNLSADVMPDFTGGINPHKVFHLMRYRGGLGDLGGIDTETGSLEDWRDYGKQLELKKYTDSRHTDFTKKDPNAGNSQWSPVSPEVLLFPESQSLEFELKNQYGRPIAALLDKLVNSTIGKVANDGLAVIAAAGAMADSGGMMGDIAGKISALAPDVAGNQQFVIKYKNIPAWTGTENLVIPGSLTFKFAFGQAGLFDAAEEVVRPILSLAMYFAPSEAGGMAHGPLPTEAFVKIKGAMAVAGAAGSAIAGVFAGQTSSIIGAVSAVYSALNNNLANIYAEGGARGIMVGRYGNLILPPFVVATVKWKFDMSQVDENGYPFRGEITLGGIESFQMATQTLIKHTVSKQYAPHVSN